MKKEEPKVEEIRTEEKQKEDGAAASGEGDRLYIGHTVYAALVEENAVCDAISMSFTALLKDRDRL